MHLVHQLLAASAQRTPDKTAMICNHEERSYAALMQDVYALSARLVETGLQKGDRVLILLNDKARYLTACYGVMAAGGIAVPLGDGAVAATIDEVTRDAEPSMLLSSADDLAGYRDINDNMSWYGCQICHLEDMLSLTNGMDRTRDFSDEAGAMILYTSGTTGHKKGVLLSHRNLVQSALHINEFMGIDAQVREYVGIPFTHSFGFGRSRCVLFKGGTLVFDNGMLNPVVMIRRIGEYLCDALSSVPSGFAMFFGRLESLLQRIGPQIRFVEIGSAAMPLDHKLKLIELLPNARICMHYGLTEASRSAFIEFHGEQAKLDTVGRPSPRVDIMVADEYGRKVEVMEQGEIVVRGAHVTAGYWRNDALNRERFTGNGWFKTGDYGFFDDEGYLHLLGRKDEIINMGGLKIAPLEVERVIAEAYPGYEACVVGLPDVDGVVGEIPVVCYVSKHDQPLSLTELSDRLAHKLERYKIPRGVYRLDTLPKTHNGKVVRRLVRQQLLRSTSSLKEAEVA